MEKFFPMLHFAQKVKRYKFNIPLYAMVHLVPSRLEKDSQTRKHLMNGQSASINFLPLAIH